MSRLLETSDLKAFYGDFQALFGIDMFVDHGETIAVIGANGAGKSIFLSAVTGMRPAKGQSILFEGELIAGFSADRIHKLGLAMVPEGRRLFPSLSVEENLLVGASGKRSGPWGLAQVYDLFPALSERKHHGGAELSGSQQQIVAIGRALMANPKLLLCNEISLGLAPKIVREIYAAVPLIRERGTSLVVIEQDIAQALKVSDRVYCFQEGRVSLSGRPADLTRDAIAQAYFGMEES